MSEMLELLLELLLNLAGSVVEAMAEIWLGDTRMPGTTAKRVFWIVVILLIGGAVWWDFH